MWHAFHESGAFALWILAYQDGGHVDFFAADPVCAAPLHGVHSNGLLYDDLESAVFLTHPLKTAGAALRDAATKLQAAQRGRIARQLAARTKAYM